MPMEMQSSVENQLAHAITQTEYDSSYDKAAKKLLANKQILAQIMKNCVNEYSTCSVDEIAEKYIEGTPEVGTVGVHVDDTNRPKKTSDVIAGSNNEDSTLTEGTINYDVRFDAIAPASEVSAILHGEAFVCCLLFMDLFKYRSAAGFFFAGIYAILIKSNQWAGGTSVEDYRTIRGTATGEYEEKKSRFIAQLSFADSEEKAVAFLEQVQAANRTARHNVYAYRLREGNRERYSDDGEPAKTAGTPALEVLQHSGLTDLIVVVTRYFGGVLLGTGGLVRAYTTATARALEAAEVVTVRSVVELEVTVDYSLYERAALLIQAAGAKLADPQFTDRVTLRWQMPEGTEPPLLEQLRELTRGGAQVSVSQPFYAPF